ncbi:MAG: PorP/SprF family type IX secretion system membrane protein [Flavobacteriales bacterium]|jgi:type IX secretion system PorP/SprF family membrane protein
MIEFIRITSKLALATFFAASTFAQDIHFSQMEFSPLTLNPALAGANSPMQGIVNYRSQWSSVATPYKTIAASLDARFNENKRNKAGIIAGGLNFFNDQSGDLQVNTTNVNVNLAYHLILDQTSTLGLGIYTGFGQRSINPNGGRWGSQYDGMTYDGMIDPGETFNSASFSYLDAGTGLLYAYRRNKGYMTQNDQLAINAGFAMYHLNRPKYSFINATNEKLYFRYSAFVNAEIGIQNTRGSVLPGVYFQQQGPAMELMYGLYYKYILSEGSRFTGFTRPMSLSLGIFNRFRDAMAAKIMFEFDQYSAGFAYDINVSSLSTVSNSKGGFELFLRFNMSDGGGFRARI